MCARLIVIFHVRQQHVAKMSFAYYDDMIDAFPADRTDQPLSTSVLPGADEDSTGHIDIVTHAPKEKPLEALAEEAKKGFDLLVVGMEKTLGGTLTCLPL